MQPPAWVSPQKDRRSIRRNSRKSWPIVAKSGVQLAKQLSESRASSSTASCSLLNLNDQNQCYYCRCATTILRHIETANDEVDDIVYQRSVSVFLYGSIFLFYLGLLLTTSQRRQRRLRPQNLKAQIALHFWPASKTALAVAWARDMVFLASTYLICLIENCWPNK